VAEAEGTKAEGAEAEVTEADVIGKCNGITTWLLH